MNYLEFILFGFRWIFTKKGRAWFETQADKMAIEKGYGKGLYLLVNKMEEKNSKAKMRWRRKFGYLSSKEIKAYAKKIGKW